MPDRYAARLPAVAREQTVPIPSAVGVGATRDEEIPRRIEGDGCTAEVPMTGVADLRDPVAVRAERGVHGAVVAEPDARADVEDAAVQIDLDGLRQSGEVSEIERLTEKYQLTVGTFGHAGDGNLHPTVLCDERNQDEMERAHKFYEELYDKVLEWGGTVSGEHGIGMAKIGYLKRQLGEGGVSILRRIKRSFDPAGLLNPGKMFEPDEAAEAKDE